MTSVLRVIGDVAAFAAELGMVAAFGFLGWRYGRYRETRILQAALGVAVGVMFWSTFFAAGGHPVHLPRLFEAGGKILLFSAAVAAFAVSGKVRWAQILAALATVGLVAEYLL